MSKLLIVSKMSKVDYQNKVLCVKRLPFSFSLFLFYHKRALLDCISADTLAIFLISV